METKSSLLYSQMPATCPYPEPTPSSPKTPCNFLKVRLNIILPSTSGSPQWSLSLRLPHQKPLHTSPFPHTRYMPRPSHSSRFYHPHYYWVRRTNSNISEGFVLPSTGYFQKSTWRWGNELLWNVYMFLYLWSLEFLSVAFFCSCWVEMLAFICQMPFRHSGLSVLFSWAYQMYYISLATWNIGKLSLYMFATYIKMLSDLDFVSSKYFTLVPYSISRGSKSDNWHL